MHSPVAPAHALHPHGGVVLTGNVHVCAQSCPTLCDPADCSPPGSSVHGILQARILQWVSNSGTEPVSLESPALGGEFFPTGRT